MNNENPVKLPRKVMSKKLEDFAKKCSGAKKTVGWIQTMPFGSVMYNGIKGLAVYKYRPKNQSGYGITVSKIKLKAEDAELLSQITNSRQYVLVPRSKYEDQLPETKPEPPTVFVSPDFSKEEVKLPSYEGLHRYREIHPIESNSNGISLNSYHNTESLWTKLVNWLRAGRFGN